MAKIAADALALLPPDSAALIALINASLDSGIACFDLADVYGGYRCEVQFGDSLAASGIRREAVRIVSTYGVRGLSPERTENTIKHDDNSGAYITRCTDLSLKALRTEYLDLLLLQRQDFLIEADDAATALDAAIRAGKIRHGNSDPGNSDAEYDFIETVFRI